MSKIPFNLYTNKFTKGKYLPKCPVIKSTPEVIAWIKENYQSTIDNHPNFWNESTEYIMFSISASYAGNLFFFINCINEDVLERYNASMIKHFDYNFEGFKKYLNWATHLPKYIINGNFNKN